MVKHPLLIKYDELKSCAKGRSYCPQVTDCIGELYSRSLDVLNSSNIVQLISLVKDKEYFAFGSHEKFSRAVNAALYDPNPQDWLQLTKAMEKNNVKGYDSAHLDKILYSVAISFCASIDLIKANDQKTPGTFFEYFVAYLFSWRLGIQPVNSIQILDIDEERTKLATDFIFNLGPKQRKFHVPVKTSTRERSVMLWAHQKLLDGVYGVGRFLGTPVLLAETKTDKTRREVIEICVPDQWRLYQLYIAKLARIYYFDLPSTYEKLNREFPPLAVRPFSEFFFESEQLSTL